MLPIKPPRAFISQSIQALVRFFGSTRVTITRVVSVYNAGFMPGTETATTVYEGDALVIPAGAQVKVMGLGVYEVKNTRLLINGAWDIRIGDTVALSGTTYRVEFPSNRWGAFTAISLQQVRQ
jgi:hypothetical protein